MARFYPVILASLVLVLFSCGQVGSITGGDKDSIAPRVITQRVTPPSESINIFPQEIRIPFDEFIEFNKPAENIKVTPDDVKLSYTINKKSVVLNKKSGEWMPNTTYTIYLNRAVKDITEGNDSIIAYVFSTGGFLDSLKTAVQVEDAYTGEPLSGITVGLFTQRLVSDTIKAEPRYYAATNKDGVALFEFVKDTTFYVYAFEDDNLNNRIDPSERRAILNQSAKLDTTFETGPIIRLMPPEDKELSVISNEVVPTSTWCIGFNRPLTDDEQFYFLSPEPLYVIWNHKKDSLSAFYGEASSSGTHSGVLQTLKKQDTLSKKFFIKDKSKLRLKISTNLSQKKLFANDTLKLKFNEPIESFDINQISLEALKEKDTINTPLDFDYFDASPIEKHLFFEKKNVEKVFLSLPPQAVKGVNFELIDSLNLDFLVQKEKETGVMIIEFDTLPAYGVLMITNKSTKLTKAVVFDGIEKTSHRIEYVQPGEYSFHYIYDLDKNGKWTTGSIFEEKDPEIIEWFTTVSTIRANWEVKTVLPIKNVKDKINSVED